MSSEFSGDNMRPVRFSLESTLKFSADERSQISILIVEPDPIDGAELRESMLSLGYAAPHVSRDHVSAIKIFQERPFTHVVFAAVETTMGALGFIKKIREIDPGIVAVPSSTDPRIDDVFTLLQNGARGFLVKPYTDSSIDECLLQATKGEPFSESLLFAANRNEAFSALISANIDSAAAAYRDARKYETAREEQEGIMKKLRSTAQLAKIFAASASEDGTTKDFASTLVDFFSGLAKGPASRLGRVRRQLQKKRRDK